MDTTVRPAAVAGRFYAADPDVLRRDVNRFLEAPSDADPANAGPCPKVLLVPHAGYVYSGAMAGRAYALLAPWRARIHRVVMLGPTHRVAVQGIAAPRASAFATPLGTVPVDHGAIGLLAGLPFVGYSDAVHAEEHALEVQLPLLQGILDRFTLVPLAVGRVRPEQVAEAIDRLWGDEGTLIVISSDLSHYLPYDAAVARDRATVERVLRLDPALDHEQACGATPLAGALLCARRHGLAPTLVGLCNSGDTAGDRARVVGYGAVAFRPTRPATAVAPDPSSAADDQDAALGAALLARARNAIAAVLGQPTCDEPGHPALAEPAATFVTLQRGGRLRGCIGSLAAHRTLDDDVRHNAAAAAFRDPRFAPLSAAEYPGLQLEVSVLGAAEALPPLGEADAVRMLRPGVDGVILEWDGRRATFLPQVWDQLPQPAAFLRALKQKAGLAADFWADDLRLSRYAVRKFTERAGRPPA